MTENREIVTVEEQKSIVEWTTQNYTKFNSKNDTYNINLLYLDKINDVFQNEAIYNTIQNIRNRIIEKENLHDNENIEPCKFLTDFLYVIEPGYRLHYHIDTHNHKTNVLKQTGVHIRFNVCIQAPDNGGRPIYAGKTLELRERNYVICRSGIDYHGSEWIFGNKSKIVLSFGFMVSNEVLPKYSNREPIIVNDYLIKSWEFKHCEFVVNDLKSLDIHKRYLLDISNSNSFNSLEKYIYNCFLFHSKNKNIDTGSCFIEFFLANKKDGLPIQYNDDTEEYPVFSILSFFNDPRSPLFFTSITNDEYKYKEYTDDNTFYIAIPKQYTHILYDSSKYNGWLDTNNTHDEPLFLNMNVWNVKPSTIDTYVYPPSDIDTSTSTDIIFYDSNNIISREIFDPTIFENILYNNHFNHLLELNSIISDSDKNANIIKVETHLNEHIDFSNVLQKYGDIATDLYPFYKEGYVNFMVTNRFTRNKCLQKFLSLDVCYWIINECEKTNKWINSPYKLYELYLNIENMPAILSFVLFISNHLITTILKQYNIQNNNIPINIRDIFVAKYSKNSNSQMKYIDNTFLTATVQLNDTADFVDGVIQFNDEDNVLIKQGELFIHNGKKFRTNGGVKDGVKYVLVFLLDIKF
uniref:Fe2OG dioxygenase domain-containing protein n=1 Tax=viral metagenome TaxID=1070528 RepID=A0A6C0HBL4_9ZZZZ